ncbi:MAG: bifunctional YncE family protein/alkaline phosphatase family protein [Capsulimonadales bacterium]|nr:bifunctional YncE family protein/alkaline phosphatase family protein [Capsulimonadales bacterium]
MKRSALLLLTVSLLLSGAGYLSSRFLPVGPTDRGGFVVATGQTIRSVGEVLTYSGRPVDMALSPDGKTLYLKDDKGFVRIDTDTWKLRQRLAFPGEGGGSLHGITVRPDGKRVFASGAGNTVWEAAVAADGSLSISRGISLPGPEGKGASYPTGLTLSGDGKTLPVCLSRNNTLAMVDLATGNVTETRPTGVAPFDVLQAGADLVVSDWGGRRAKEGDRTADSAGTPTVVDERGVASTGTVTQFSADGTVRTLSVGRHPSDLVATPDGKTLFVANANDDTVSVIENGTVRETLVVKPDPKLPFGSMPNALALSPDGKTLFVACGGNNAVAVVSLRPMRVLGWIPAGWYPGALATDGKYLYIANIKGNGSRTATEKTAKEGWNVYQYQGTVQRVALPDTATLAKYTARVRADARVPEVLRTAERQRSGKAPVPVPERVGEPSVFKHVVYVIKENRTYDQVFGDLKQGNGDPNLCLYGREVTPNHHALAEQFVLLDNFYCNGVLSADGHSWATEGHVTDHLEKAFGGFTRSYTFGDDPLTYSSSGLLWDNVLARGLSFRNYGEMDYTDAVPDPGFVAILKDRNEKTGKITFKHKIGIDRLARYSSPDCPGWNMNIPDQIRADIFLRDLKEFERNGNLPNLTIVYLPNDHTSGVAPGVPTPRALMADNDLALGRVVEGLAKSRFWPQTCIFVVEDDPQAGFDHVDGHRSPCLVVSPYTRRGAVVKEFYNQTSVLHTMERILGVPPMNQMDALAPLMTACFTGKPDLRPFTALPNRVPLDEVTPARSAMTPRMRRFADLTAWQNFREVDAIDEDAMNRILWFAAKGDRPYPAHFAARARPDDED